eukprot:scaffold57980_cov16-Tisochrysis_lutea.AAC.1
MDGARTRNFPACKPQVSKSPCMRHIFPHMGILRHETAAVRCSAHDPHMSRTYTSHHRGYLEL